MKSGLVAPGVISAAAAKASAVAPTTKTAAAAPAVNDENSVNGSTPSRATTRKRAAKGLSEATASPKKRSKAAAAKKGGAKKKDGKGSAAGDAGATSVDADAAVAAAVEDEEEDRAHQGESNGDGEKTKKRKNAAGKKAASSKAKSSGSADPLAELRELVDRELEDDGAEVEETIAPCVRAAKFDYKTKIAQQVAWIKRLRERLVATEASRVALRDAADEAEEKVASAIEETSERADALQKDLDIACSRAADLSIAKDAAEEKVDAAIEENKALDARVTRLEADLARAKSDVEAARETEAALRAEIGTAKESAESAARDAEKAEEARAAERASWDAERARADADLAAQRERAEVAEARATEAEARVAEEKTKAAVLEAQLESHKDKVTKAEEDVGRAQADVEAARSELNLAREREARADARVEAKEAEAREAARAFASAQEAQAQQMRQVQEERAAVARDNDTLRETNESLRAEIASVGHEISALRAKVDDMADEIRAAEDRAAAQTADAEAARAEVARLRPCEDEVASLRAEMEAIREHCGATSAEQMGHLAKMQGELAVARKRIEELEGSSGASRSELERVKAENASLVESRLEADAERRRLFNVLQDLRGKVRVCARVRPVLAGDGPGADAEAGPIAFKSADKLELDARGSTYPFKLDHVFGPVATQRDVFAEVSNFVQSALDGYRVCLFAYGQTGSGKTFTMQGDPERSEARGMIHRSVDKIFAASEQMAEAGWSIEIRASFMEIYNESIRDLLRDGKADPSVKHDIKHDPEGNTTVSNLTYLPVPNAASVDEIMRRAAENRTVARTNMNDVSSRSHAVFCLDIVGTNTHSGEDIRGSLNLCDLAGSERLSRSGATGQNLKETQAINKSLSALSDVFNAIAKKQSHVPFRNSKLTYFLQPCLSGSGKALMMVNLSPTATSAPETLCSLRFAQFVSQSCELGKPKQQKRTAGVAKPKTEDSAAAESDAKKPKRKRPATAN